MDNKLFLQNVRVSFLVLGDPEDYNGDKRFRWSAVALVPYASDTHKAVLGKLKDVCKAEEKWGKKWESIYEAIISDRKSCCYADGKHKDYDGYEGHFALSAYRYASAGRPLVFDKDKSPIYKPDNSLYEGKGGKLYSGMYANVHVEFWAQDNTNGKGLRCTLLGIQAHKEGASFGGGSKPTADVFAEVAEGSDDDALS